MGSYALPTPQQFQNIKVEHLWEEDDGLPRVPQDRGSDPLPKYQQFGSYPNHDETSEEESDGSFVEESEDERDILRPGSHTLGPSKGYVSSWTRVNAFRELYQNWKDALIAFFDLDPRAFNPVLEHVKDHIHITIHREHAPGTGIPSPELLGFIRYNKKHRVKFEASSYHWNFGFRGVNDSLYCRLSRAKPDFVQRKKDAFAADQIAGRRRGLTSNIWQDVTIRISKGPGGFGRKILENDFLSWLGVSLDIQGPQSADIVRTDHGDLILDKQFAGRIYLKGLRVSDSGPDGRGYVFGYNFVRGGIDRDRNRMLNTLEEAEMLAKIWEQSISVRGHDVTNNYINLFYHYRDCADIASAEKNVSSVVARAIWHHLRTVSPNAFYYSEKNDSQSVIVDQTNIITTDLKKTPTKLPETLWKILRKFSLARTPEEERFRLFENSETVTANEDVFCTSVLRALSACLSLDRKIEEIRIQFVEGGHTGIDLLFREEERVLRIHAKWIDFQRVHESASCQVSRVALERDVAMEAFLCDHVVDDLFELILNNIRGPLKLDQLESVTLRRLARERIQQTPRLIKLSRTSGGNELEVSWTGNETEIIAKSYGADIRYHVTLHKMSTCGQKRDESFHQFSPETESAPIKPRSNPERTVANDAPCGCAHQIASWSDAKAIFSDLDHREEYFPMVARVGNRTFFGVPPAAVAPEAAADCNGTPLVRKTHPVTNIATQPALERQETTADHVALESFPDNSDDDDNREDSSVRVHIGTRPITADTNHRLPHARSSNRRQGLRKTVAIDRSASEQDEKTWQTWHEQDLSRDFSRLIPKRGTKSLETMSSISCLFCPRLEYTFEENEFARIRLNSEDSPELIISVHDIREEDGCSGAKSYYLIVAKYSFLRSAYPFRAQQSSKDTEVVISNREVLLHFEDFAKMGKAEDAEVIRLDDISCAEDLTSASEILSDSVHHVVQLPSGSDARGLFCRFAICNAVRPNAACITPIASGLLPHHERWKQRKFVDPPQPLVFDLTPNVLGPSEGFSQAGCIINAGFGFDPNCHATWKIRHPSCQVYDGSPLNVFDEFASGELPLPTFPNPEHPRIAVAAGENTSFRLSDGNKEMPSVEEFLRPLELLDAAAKSPLEPDFLVLLMPPAVLHDSTIGRFSKSILILLEKRFSVHIRLSSLQEYGIPLERSTLIIIASRLCASLPWGIDQSFTGASPPVKDLIGDLVFENPRTSQGARDGFVCSVPAQNHSTSGGDSSRMKIVYNHQTGRLAPLGETPIDMNSNAIFVSCTGSKSLVHPDRRDLLTTREIARIYRFEDDFVFYNSELSQRMDVLKAFPPNMARLIAGAIFKSIRSVRVVRLNDPGEGPRHNKRARIEYDG